MAKQEHDDAPPPEAVRMAAAVIAAIFSSGRPLTAEDVIKQAAKFERYILEGSK